jgi:6-pyruvoyltetrahydropterin/6-carboxytetrahydropterin synthase
MIGITRVYRFSASHRLHSPQLSDRENAEIFGKCNNPYGHGHDYVLSVTVNGEVDRRTGILIPVSALDRLVREKVLDLFSYRNINMDVPQFARLIPTTENIALVIAGLLQEHWAEYLGVERARLHRVHVQETERNGFEVLLPVSHPIERPNDTEGSLVHA